MKKTERVPFGDLQLGVNRTYGVPDEGTARPWWTKLDHRCEQVFFDDADRLDGVRFGFQGMKCKGNSSMF